MRSFLVLFVALCLQTPNSAQTVSSTPTSTEILRATVKAIEKAEAVEYEVRRGALKPGDPTARLQTTIVLTRDPLRFLAKTTNENGQVVAMAVSDGKTTRTSSDGKVGEHPTFARDGKTMGATTLPNADVAVTRQWFDPNFLNEAINSQRTILLGQSEVEGELCHIIFYARPTSSPDFISTQYAWISATTGLPHALQILSISRGNSGLGSRLALSKIHFNPVLAAETFTYQPKATDSIPTATDESAAEPVGIIGKQLPALEVRDMEFKARRLSDFKGFPTLITFWASWCGPCVREMPTLQKLLDEYKGKLQVLAIAVQEERRASMQFIKDHPQYKFTFLTEPAPGEANTPMQTFFQIRTIPVGAFVGADGKILDRWFGFSNEEEFVKKTQRLVGQ